MNDRQRELLFVFAASTGVGLIGGLAYNVTSNVVVPSKIDLHPASPEQQSRPIIQQPSPPERRDPSAAPGCVVPPGGGPPVTRDFQPC